MPKVEAEYRVARDRRGRAIAGLSMGGLESLQIGLEHTDTFASIGGFSSAVHLLDPAAHFPAITGKRADLRVLWIACGTEDNLLEANRKFAAYMKAKGLPATEVETAGGHVSFVWRDNLIHFAPLLFR